MTEDFQLRTDPRTAADTHRVMHALAAQQDIEPNRMKALRIIKRSIDARQRNVMVNLTVRCWLDEEPATIALYEPIHYGDVSSSEKRAVVVGAGPGGLFAALRELDDPTIHQVYARCPVGGGVAYAVQNRLRKAAAFHIVDAEEEA